MVLHSRLRSWLTIIGIVIGVASVIAIVSLGEGMQQSMGQQLGGLGGDIVTLTAGYSRGAGMMGAMPGGGAMGRDSSRATSAATSTNSVTIGRKDLQALSAIPEILMIDTNINGRVEVAYLGKTGSVSLTGVDQRVWSRITTSKIRDGRMLDPADQNVVVIGGRLSDSYFDRPLGINQMISIEGSAFRVVGVLDDTSTNIYMPISMAYQIIDGKENGVYDSIAIKVRDEDKLDEAMEIIEKKLMNVRHVNENTKDFSLSSNRQMTQARTEMMSSMAMFLAAIAAVSLMVGAVGVANTMFTSVLEKTKEIGIMKAIGARNKDILLIFVLNAGIIGLVGGIFGTIFGSILSGMLPALMGDIGIFRGGGLVTPEIVVLALGVSVAVGIIAGFVPAYQASKLKPVDALRYG
jgi:putative ABC transport system permease protein